MGNDALHQRARQLLDRAQLLPALSAYLRCALRRAAARVP
jgi:hypothetical protein